VTTTTTTITTIPIPMSSGNGYDPQSFNLNQTWGNPSPPITTSNGTASFDHNSSHPQSQILQEQGALVSPTSYPYSDLNQIAGASDVSQHASYPALISPVQVSPVSSTTSRDSRTSRGHYRDAPQSVVLPRLDITGQAQNYAAAATWNAPSDPPVLAGRSRPDSQSRPPPGLDYNSHTPTLPLLDERQRRSSSNQVASQHFKQEASSQRYDPPSPQIQAQEGTRMAIDPSPGLQPRCILRGCKYPAYFNVAEQEQKEYCGHGHEIEAIETGFAKPCAICKGRPRRVGERVCGPVCRDRERQALQVQGSYYGVPVTRREPQTRPR